MSLDKGLIAIDRSVRNNTTFIAMARLPMPNNTAVTDIGIDSPVTWNDPVKSMENQVVHE